MLMLAQIPRGRLSLLLLAALLFVSCAEVRFVGSSAGKLRVLPENRISPAAALDLARPHLARAWQLRCRHIHHDDRHWCGRAPTDFIVQQGDYYYITRTSYPYKTLRAYLRYAVRVHAQDGQVRPAEKP